MHGRNPRVQQHAKIRRRDPLVDAAVGANRVGNQPVVPARAVRSEESPRSRRVLAQEAHIGRLETTDFAWRRLIQPVRDPAGRYPHQKKRRCHRQRVWPNESEKRCDTAGDHRRPFQVQVDGAPGVERRLRRGFPFEQAPSRQEHSRERADNRVDRQQRVVEQIREVQRDDEMRSQERGQRCDRPRPERRRTTTAQGPTQTINASSLAQAGPPRRPLSTRRRAAGRTTPRAAAPASTARPASAADCRESSSARWRRAGCQPAGAERRAPG